MDRRTFVKSAAVTVSTGVAAGYLVGEPLKGARSSGRAMSRSRDWRPVDAARIPRDPVVTACSELGATYAVGGTAANLALGRVPGQSNLVVDAAKGAILGRLGDRAKPLVPHPWDHASDLRLESGGALYAVACMGLDLYHYRTSWAFKNRPAPYRHMSVALDLKAGRLHDPDGFVATAGPGELTPSESAGRSLANVLTGFKEAAQHRLTPGDAFTSYVDEVMRLRGRNHCATVVQLLDAFPALYAVLGVDGLGKFLDSPMSADALARELNFRPSSFAARVAEHSAAAGKRHSPEVVALSCLFADSADDPRDVANFCFLRQGQIPSNIGMVREAVDLARTYRSLA